MLKKHVITGALVATFAAAGAGAQTPPATSGSPSQPGTTTTTQPGTTQSGSMDTTADQRSSTTLTGCVYEEKDVPGRSPNIAEQAGVLEDYILAVSDEPSASGSTTGAAGTSGSTAGTSGTMASASSAKMFKLEHADDDKLKGFVGKRVEVMGRVDAEPGDTANRPAGTSGSAGADQSLGPDDIELPEFEVTSIREVSGDCPAKPAAR